MLAIYPERDVRKIRDRDVAQIRISGGDNIRKQSIPHLRLCKSKGAFCILGKQPLLGQESSEDAVLDGEDGIRDLARGARDKISG